MNKVKFGKGEKPTSRSEQWKQIFKEHYAEIISASLYTFVFWIPLFAWVLFAFNFEIFQENSILNVLVLYSGIALTLIIAGLGLAGGFYVFRKFLWNEGCNVHLDFFKGIKQNGKQFAQIYLFIGIMYLLLHVVSQAIMVTEWSDISIIAFLAIEYVVFICLLIVAFFMQTQTIFYENSFKQSFKNGIRFLVGTVLKSLGLFVVLFLPFILYEFVPNGTVKLIAILISAIIYFGILELTFMCHSLELFDKYINKKQHPDYYLKGLDKVEKVDF
ncbi:MAG: hypothetical protein J1F32_07060 [Erysipelotrichales bacterium]|nr:hypothetical protein [Erysipelotrichales bacterium]